MNEMHNYALEAAADVQGLMEIHRRFLDALPKHAAKTLPYGSLSVTGGLFRAMCFGVDFSVTHRMVVVDGRFKANEYAFFAKWLGEEHQVYAVYLPVQGTLYASPDETGRLCDFNNPFLPEHLLAALGAAFMKSKLVAPGPTMNVF